MRITASYGQRIGSKVAGVTKRNADGTDRQSIIRAKCRGGDPLFLEPEPDNPYDSNAIKVRLRSGEQIGYLNKFRAEQVTRLLKRGPMSAEILEVTGGGPGESLGVNIEIFHEADRHTTVSGYREPIHRPEPSRGWRDAIMIIAGGALLLTLIVGSCAK